MGFWNLEHLDLGDSLNADIWSRSPALQRRIQPPSVLRQPGAIGAQQAMLAPGSDVPTFITPESILPWVPDLVGTRWREPGSVLVVGSAYAGFIAQYSQRKRTMALADYARAGSTAEFQRRYVRDVVDSDRNYYDSIKSLVGGAGGFTNASRIAVFDLCRASFVERGDGRHTRKDKWDDSVVRRGRAAFAQYVDGETEAGNPADWTWQRILGSQAVRIVALGRIAEHGLLRLFHQRGLSIHRSDMPSVPWTPRPSANGEWVNWQADARCNIGFWLRQGAWWTITGTIEGAQRTWHLLPAYHPASRSTVDSDRGYSITRAVLTRIWASERGTPDRV